jgi:hypothetical protein
MNDLKIHAYTPPLYPGHNNHHNYRILGFIPYMLIGYETIKMNVFMLIRYKYAGSGLNRQVPFQNISNKIILPYIISLPVYIVFDIIHRNRKYNKNKSYKEKALYTTDLILFHSLATVMFPLYISKYLANFFSKSFGFFVRSRIPLMFVSLTAFLATGVVAAKSSDIIADMILDISFRKIVYNFKESDSNKLCNTSDSSNQHVDMAGVVENIVKI